MSNNTNGSFSPASMRDMNINDSTITIHGTNADGKKQFYDAKKTTIPAVRKDLLGILSSILSLLTFFTGYQSIKELVEVFQNNDKLEAIDWAKLIGSIVCFIILLIVTVFLWRLFRFSSRKIMKFFKIKKNHFLAPFAEDKESIRKIGIFKMSAVCSKCGRGMKIQRNKNGREYLQCKNNPEHKARFDLSDYSEYMHQE